MGYTITTCCTIFLLYAFAALRSLQAEPTRPPFSCDSSNALTSSYPFCNSSLSIPERVGDLVSRLTLEEKISQLVNSAAAIPRLNVSAHEWWSEALHGVSRHGRGIRFNGTVHAATMFPQTILSAASFDERLWYRIGQAIGREARAMYNAGQAMGMTYWAPNINIIRDPRWGRSQETAGEDPPMVGKYGVAYVRGIQGDSFEGGALKDHHLQASACCKHFVAQDLDNWHNVTRYVFDAKVGEQDMADSFMPPFKRCVEEGKASSIMCAYNLVNGVPNCANYDLLTKTARQQWGFQGYIVSDCDAVQIIHDQQGYAKLPEDAAALVLKAGMDLNCGSYLSKYTMLAVEKKKVQESDIDRALNNLFSVRMRLGLFDGDPKELEYGDIAPKEICSQEHRDLALEAVRNGIVLLKNSAGLLPLSKTQTASLAVIGPSANASEPLLGNYEGFPCKNVTFLQALQSYVSDTMYHQGCNFVNCTSTATDEAIKIAEVADNVVLIMGLDQTQEREKLDRTDLILPGKQESLISDIAKVAKKPVVLVLLSGGPIDVSFAKENPKIGSILWIGYPGEMGGIALAETIFGDNNPGGKLPSTWYPQDFIKIPMTDMRMRPENSTGYPGRTYRFYTGPKVFEFGYGLSYTNHLYKFTSVTQNNLHLTHFSSTPKTSVSVSEIQPEICRVAAFSAKVRVQNDGKIASKHPVLLFLRQDRRGQRDPIKQLVGFQSVKLNAGESSEIEFVVNPCEHFSKASENGSMVIERGKYFLVVEDEEYPISVVT
nr:probable beta-D-xylosidase 7 [Ipomoea batatas]